MAEFKGTNEDWFLSGLEIVSMPSQIKIAKISGANYEQAKANALLISKAPEMLEMLDKILFKVFWNGGNLNMKDKDAIEKLIKEAIVLPEK